MDFLDFAGDLVQAGLGYKGAVETNAANADIAAANNQWSAQQYATRYQTMTHDMMNAGLNPMLAYSQSAGQAPTAQAVTFQNPWLAATSAYQGAQSSRAGASRDIASATQAETESRRIEADIKRIDQSVENMKEEFKNIPLEGKRLEQAAQQLAHQVNLTISQEFLTNAQREQIYATVAKLKKETRLLDFDVTAADDMENLGRRSSQLKPIFDIMRQFAPRR